MESSKRQTNGTTGNHIEVPAFSHKALMFMSAEDGIDSIALEGFYVFVPQGLLDAEIVLWLVIFLQKERNVSKNKYKSAFFGAGGNVRG